MTTFQPPPCFFRSRRPTNAPLHAGIHWIRKTNGEVRKRGLSKYAQLQKQTVHIFRQSAMNYVLWFPEKAQAWNEHKEKLKYRTQRLALPIFYSFYFVCPWLLFYSLPKRLSYNTSSPVFRTFQTLLHVSHPIYYRLLWVSHTGQTNIFFRSGAPQLAPVFQFFLNTVEKK